MSYDVWLEIDTGGPKPAPVGLTAWNCTSNLSGMWRAAGFDLAECSGKTAAECIPLLRSAIAELDAHPGKYRPMDAANGWGTYEQLVPALRELLADWEAHPRATVVVCR